MLSFLGGEIHPGLTSGVISTHTHTHTPSDASNYLHISVEAVVKALGGCSVEFQLSIEVNGAAVGATLFLVSHGTVDSGNVSHVCTPHTNSNTTTKTMVFRS